MKTSKSLKVLIVCSLAVAFGLSACWPNLQQPSSPDAIYTFAAQTIIPMYTRSAGETAVAFLTQPALATPVQGLPSEGAQATTALPPTEASATFTATPTLTQALPTATSTPTFTPITPIVIWIPTATPIPPTAPPAPTAVPVPCNRATFVRDVTVLDGSTFPPGAVFTKTWRLKNSGTCSWGLNYELVFTGGSRMQKYNSVPLLEIVPPGATVDMSVELVAPSKQGHYRGYWMLSNAQAQTFGIGASGTNPFWVDIQVSVEGGLYAFDFTQYMCNASWKSSAGNLPCPGDQDDPYGSVVRLDKPYLETGKHENEPGLWTRPETTHGGWIKGAFPRYEVESGDHFMADVGCLQDSKGCDVTFFLDYQIQGQPVQNLGSWHEVYDKHLTRIDIDLSSLAGESVQFILRVVNNAKAKAEEADAFWLAPSIRWIGP